MPLTNPLVLINILAGALLITAQEILNYVEKIVVNIKG